MEPYDIVIVTYNRKHLLERTLDGIRERTKTPYRIIVVDNCSMEDDTIPYLKKCKEDGKIDVLILNKENRGLAPAYNIGFEYVKSELFFTTNDDLIPPDLEPDWIIRMVELFKKYYPEYGAISMRCPRLRNLHFNNGTTINWLPHDEIGETRRSSSALFRIHRKDDIAKNSVFFGTQAGYRDEYQFKKAMDKIGMRSGYARDIWCNHIGYALDNRGFPKGFITYAGYSEGRNSKNKKLGYPKVDLKTNVPIAGQKY